MKHIHGGSPEYYFKKFGIPERDVIDFSVNINPLGPPEIVKEIWNEIFYKICRYPEIEGKGVKEFYKNRFHIPEDFILPGNGSTEIIYLVAREIPAKRILILKPSYFDYERATILSGKEVISLYSDPFGYEDIEEKISKALVKADAVWIGRPNNPTGRLIPKGFILDIAKRFPEKWIILDEAFIQFIKDWERETFISPDIPKNILVIHSLTKFYAIPGIRIGALISRPENISFFSSKKEPWTVNVVAEEVARRLSSCIEYEERSISFIERERVKLYEAFLRSDRIIPIPSVANFILCKYNGNLDELLMDLLRNGIYIRDCRNFDGLSGNFLRIGIRTSEENDRLISELK